MTIPERYDVAEVDLGSVDGVLTTTRAVRMRLDLDRPVDDQIILDCIDVAEQAPTGGNQSSRRWLVVRNPKTKAALAEIYHDAAGSFLLEARDRLAGTGHRAESTMRSAAYLVEHLHEVPAIVIPCIWGTHDGSGRPGLFDSVIQSAWSFCLAARTRGLATAWTTAYLGERERAAELLDIPDGVTQVALLPVVWSKGTDFGSADRRPANEVAYFDRWGHTWEHRFGGGPRGYGEGPGATAEIDIEAPASAVWSIVTDVALPGRFSEEHQRAEWAEGFDGPALGAQFVGTNIHSAIGEWQTTSTVTEYEPNVRFGWAVGDLEAPAARWRFEIDALQDGTCRLRHTSRIGPGPSGLTVPIDAMPDKEPAILAGRQAEHLANMRRVIEGAKALAESRK